METPASPSNCSTIRPPTAAAAVLSLLLSAGVVAQEDIAAGAPGAAADADPSVAAEMPQEDPATIVTRFELQIEFDDMIAAADFAAAAALAPRLIALAEEEFGADSALYADTLIRVAEGQTGAGEYEAAEENALLAVEIYREQEGGFSPSLIRPYLVLGDNYHAAEDYVSAMPAYEEARNISRRIDGLLNTGQIEILERMSASAEGLNQITEAQELQLDALELVERRFEPHSREVVDGALRYGQWLREHNLFTPERELYTRIERGVAEQYGQESVEIVPLLLARANSFRSQALIERQGVESLEQALEIAERSGGARLQAEVYRDLGDWEAAFSQRGTDGTAYLRAWSLLGEIEGGDALREEWFGAGTQFVLIAARSQRGFSTDPDAATGRLIIRFTVEPSGITSDVRITDADPPGIAEEAFARQIRASRFRPMIRNGQLVAARRAFSATFRYDPEDHD